jgi:hypothetical protein
MYNIFGYDTLILFFVIKTTLIFFLIYLSDFVSKFVEFVRATSVDMC